MGNPRLSINKFTLWSQDLQSEIDQISNTFIYDGAYKCPSEGWIIPMLWNSKVDAFSWTVEIASEVYVQSGQDSWDIVFYRTWNHMLPPTKHEAATNSWLALCQQVSSIVSSVRISILNQHRPCKGLHLPRVNKLPWLQWHPNYRWHAASPYWLKTARTGTKAFIAPGFPIYSISPCWPM